MIKGIVFDMDGTIADLYGVDGWEPMLRHEVADPYLNAEPLWDMSELVKILKELRTKGIKIIITSWLAKNSTIEYDSKVRQAKLEWLEKWGFPYDECHLVKYGTTKANCTRKLGEQILIDDNAIVRQGWTLGDTVNPTEINIIEYLKNLLTK